MKASCDTEGELAQTNEWSEEWLARDWSDTFGTKHWRRPLGPCMLDHACEARQLLDPTLPGVGRVNHRVTERTRERENERTRERENERTRETKRESSNLTA